MVEHRPSKGLEKKPSEIRVVFFLFNTQHPLFICPTAPGPWAFSEHPRCKDIQPTPSTSDAKINDQPPSISTHLHLPLSLTQHTYISLSHTHKQVLVPFWHLLNKLVHLLNKLLNTLVALARQTRATPLCEFPIPHGGCDSECSFCGPRRFSTAGSTPSAPAGSRRYARSGRA